MSAQVVADLDAALLDDREDRADQVLVGAHASGDAVEDDADALGFQCVSLLDAIYAGSFKSRSHCGTSIFAFPDIGEVQTAKCKMKSANDILLHFALCTLHFALSYITAGDARCSLGLNPTSLLNHREKIATDGNPNWADTSCTFRFGSSNSPRASATRRCVM